MENIDAIIYSKNLINTLLDSGFFNEIDPFVEKEPLYEEILKVANQNTTEHGDPSLTDVQFETAVTDVRRKSIGEAFDSLVEKGKLKIDGIDKDGNFLYAINEK